MGGGLENLSKINKQGGGLESRECFHDDLRI